LDKCRVSRSNGFGLSFNNLAISSVNLGLDFFKLASDMSGVAIKDWSIAILD
jgi:hypothetical protein